MTPLPHSHPGARVAFYALFGVFVVLEWRVRLSSVLNRSGSSADRSSRALVYATIVFGLLGTFWFAADVPGAAIRFARWPIFIAGLALMAIGICVRQWAVLMLGRFFTTDVRVHSGQTVVDRGPYRWVRHPSYTGLLATLVGIGLALGNWAALATVIVLPTIGLIIRIRVEERALLDALGEPYRRFAATRARLVPHVW